MTNAYQYAQQLGFTGTSQQIVDQLKAIKRHRKNVYITGGPCDTSSVNLLHLLTARHRVMGMGPAQQWTGPLIDLEATNPTVSMVLSILRPLLQVNDTQVYCAESDDAADMLNELTTIVGQITQKSAQVTAEVALLSGGRIGAEFADLTLQKYNADKAIVDAAAAEDALASYRQSLQVRFHAIKNKIGTVEQSDAADELEAMAAEVRAR